LVPLSKEADALLQVGLSGFSAHQAAGIDSFLKNNIPFMCLYTSFSLMEIEDSLGNSNEFA